MALLKVIFPHQDEQGNHYAAGDHREVPDHLVDFYLKPAPQLGIVVMVKDHRTVITDIESTLVNREPSFEEELQALEKEKELAVQNSSEEVLESEAVETRARKRKN